MWQQRGRQEFISKGIFKGKMGYSYTEKLMEDSLDELINNLIQYAENNHGDEVEKMSSSILESKKTVLKGKLIR